MAYPGIAMPFEDTGSYSPSKLGKQTDDEKAKDAQKYLQVLADQRLPWEPQIDNLIAYVNHGRRGIQGKDLWPGQPTGMDVYDDSAMAAKNKLVDGMVGYLCPRNQVWFALQIPGKFNFPRMSRMRSWSGKRIDSYPAVQRWIQDTQDVMYSAFDRSNFYDKIPQFIADGAVCGTGHLIIEEDVKAARTVFTVPHFRECYIAEDENGFVDTNYRVYKMTLRQFVQKFSLETMEGADPNFKKDYQTNMHSERDVLHAVYPRADYDPRRRDAKGKKWESVWVYRKGGKILTTSGDMQMGSDKVTLLSEGGYDSKSTLSWRWDKNSDECYGRGPAHNAYVAIMLANQIGRTNLITGQKAAEPPLVAYEDHRGKIMRGPNGMTFIPPNRGALRDIMPQPLTTGVQSLPFTIEYQERVGQIINEHFHADVFTMLSQIGQQKGMGRPVTEQITEMQGEKAAVLGTRIGNLQSEAFDPLIERMYDIEAQAGRIPEVPQILLESSHGGVLVEYLGMLAQAQSRLTRVRSIQSGIAMVLQITQADPIAAHAIDFDQAVREAWDGAGAPISCLRPPEAIAKIREMAQQQQEKQQQIENAPKIAKAAALAGKSAEQNSPMQALLGSGKDIGG